MLECDFNTVLKQTLLMLFISNYTEPVWSEWNIGRCSKTCGKGSRVDYRDCLQGSCEGEEQRIVECFSYECISKFNNILH